MSATVLLVDDEQGIQFGFSKYLAKAGYGIQGAMSLDEAQAMLLKHRFDAVLLDMNLPDGNGLDLIADLRRTYPGMAIIVISGAGDVPMAVEAMRRGADNFLVKPVNMGDLDVFLQKSLEIGNLRRRDLSQRRLAKADGFFFGESPAMQHVLSLASLAAANDSPVQLLGETGTGKGMLSRWIHDHSARASASFVEVNCSTLKGDLLASELFGHVRGAFTTAIQDRQGLIEVADGGTLFLDEIADMDIGVQAQFLKVIEEKQFRRVGETKIRRSEFRLICATNRDLSAEIAAGRFRQDLFFRLYVFPILIPPLRERTEDVPALAAHVGAAIGHGALEISPEAMSALSAYEWPGNVRELRNVLERAMILSRGAAITTAHLPGIAADQKDCVAKEVVLDLDARESAHIRQVLESFGGDARKASEALGISLRTLYRKLERARKAL